MTWMQTLNGRSFSLTNPQAGDIDREEIARAISRIPRFLGHTLGPVAYSVAQHQVVGYETILDATGDSRLAQLFLHHDDHEAYIGDITTPAAQALAFYAPEVRSALRNIKLSIDAAIWTSFGILPPTSAECAAVKAWDARMLIAEHDLLMVEPPYPWRISAKPAPCDQESLEPWPAMVAEREWLYAVAQA